MPGIDAQLAMRTAAEHHRAGRKSAAAEQCRAALEADPRRSDAIHLLGILAWEDGRHSDAVDLIQQAISINQSQPQFHGNLGLVLMDQKKYDDAIAAFSRSLALRPMSAKTHNDVGTAFAAKGFTQQAAESFRTALSIQPDFPEALYNLGNALRALGEWEEAVVQFRKAIGLRPGWAEAQNNLGNALCQLGRLEEGTAAYRSALMFKPDSEELNNNLGNAYYAAGNLDFAQTFYEAALQIDPAYASAHWNLALIHLTRGEFEKGWPLYEWRWKVPELGFHSQFPGEMWDGRELNGQRILIHNEQGFGDILQFCRYIPMLIERGGKVILSVDPSLHRLLSRQWNLEQVVDDRAEKPAYDVHCPLLSLPLVFKTTLAGIPSRVPYIAADPLITETWKARVPHDGRKKIGLCWSGRRQPDPMRAMMPADLAPLAGAAGAWFCSLQIGESELVPEKLKLTDWTSELRDFAQTAALVDNLDLVITVDTALAHLCGAMGKPTWLFLKHAADWRWMQDREDSPWYPTMRLFRQEKLGDWTLPVQRVAQALQAVLP